MKLYTLEKADRIIQDNAALIESVCASCRIPPSFLKAVLCMEIPEIDISDIIADKLVTFNWFRYSLFHIYTLLADTVVYIAI